MTNNLSSGDYVGMSFWLISMALVAATAFFFLERDRVAGKWKTSLTVSGLVTLIAAVHYFYMRDVWKHFHDRAKTTLWMLHTHTDLWQLLHRH